MSGLITDLIKPFLPSPPGGVAAPSYTIDTLTPADIATITGKAAPTLMWLGKDASGATELVSGTANLVDSSTPVKEVDATSLGGTATEFNSINDAMDAGVNTVADIGAGVTVTIMTIFRFVVNPAGNLAIVGKPQAAAGYEIRTLATGTIAWNIYEASGGHNRWVNIDHGTTNVQTVLATRSVTDNVSALWTREGTVTGTDGFGGTLSNTNLFSVGQSAIRSTAYFRTGMTAIWIGASGDGFGEADRLAVAQALGYE